MAARGALTGQPAEVSEDRMSAETLDRLAPTAVPDLLTESDRASRTTRSWVLEGGAAPRKAVWNALAERGRTTTLARRSRDRDDPALAGGYGGRGGPMRVILQTRRLAITRGG